MACLEHSYEPAFSCAKCEMRKQLERQREALERMQAQFEKIEPLMDKLLTPSVTGQFGFGHANFTPEGVDHMKRLILGERLHEIGQTIKRPKIRRKAKRAH